MRGAAHRRKPIVKTSGAAAVQPHDRRRVGQQVTRDHVAKHATHLRVVQHLGEVMPRGRRCHGCHHDASTQGTQEEHRVTHRAGGANGDGLALSHTITLQRGSHPIHQRIQLAPVQGLGIVAKGRDKRSLLCVLANQRRDGDKRRV